MNCNTCTSLEIMITNEESQRESRFQYFRKLGIPGTIPVITH